MKSVKKKSSKKASNKLLKDAIDERRYVKSASFKAQLTDEALRDAIVTLGKIAKITLPESSPESESYEEPEPIDLRTHCAEMHESFYYEIEKLEEWVLLDITTEYALAARRVNCKVHFSLNEDSSWMQPFTDIQKRSFCVLKVFVWTDEAKQLDLVKKLQAIGAEVRDLFVVKDIKTALGAV